MQDIVEDQEDRTIGFRPPEPRGFHMRWIALAVAAVVVGVVVLAKVLPPAGGSHPADAPAAHVAK